MLVWPSRRSDGAPTGVSPSALTVKSCVKPASGGMAARVAVAGLTVAASVAAAPSGVGPVGVSLGATTASEATRQYTSSKFSQSQRSLFLALRVTAVSVPASRVKSISMACHWLSAGNGCWLASRDSTRHSPSSVASERTVKWSLTSRPWGTPVICTSSAPPPAWPALTRA